MDPLLALRALPTHVKHAEVVALDAELALDHAGCLVARAQDVVIARHVFALAQLVHLVRHEL